MERLKAGSHKKLGFGHRTGSSPCTHSIGKFFLWFIVFFPLRLPPPARPGTTCKIYYLLIILLSSKASGLPRYLGHRAISQNSAVELSCVAQQAWLAIKHSSWGLKVCDNDDFPTGFCQNVSAWQHIWMCDFTRPETLNLRSLGAAGRKIVILKNFQVIRLPAIRSWCTFWRSIFIVLAVGKLEIVLAKSNTVL